MEKIINFYSNFIKLEKVIRKGWVMCNVPEERMESVGDHTLQTLMLASVITKELKLNVDTFKLMEMLLIHDIGETIIGDISIVEDDYEIKKQKEREAVHKVLTNLSEDTSNYYYNLWCEMEQQNTPIAKLAFQIDKLDAVIKAKIYENNYNLNGLFDEFYSHQEEKQTFQNSVLEDGFNKLKK